MKSAFVTRRSYLVSRMLVTPVSRISVSAYYWTRERRLFFCQIEAVETIIYLTEIAPRHDANHGTFILERLRQANAQATPDGHAALLRYAAKMATGSGKTVVMGMLLAWQALNKLANRQDQRFSDAFLIVSPGITIRDRLRVLLPSDPNSYYRQLDLLPPSLREELGKAKVAIINYHAFIRRERNSAASLTKKLLTVSGEASPFQETEGQMVARVCADLGNKKNIVVLNDEAHHCYHRRPVDVDEKLSGDDLQEAKQREEEAKIWIGGLGAVQKKLGIRAVYDLSATPFFLRGSGYDEGTLVPVGDLGFLPDRRHRKRHRQGAARAGGRQHRPGREPDLSQPVGAHRQGHAQGPGRQGGRPARARPCPRSCRARCTASTATTRRRISSGKRR